MSDVTRASAPGAQAGKQVYVHIGEPKTGSTFLQEVLWNNRAELSVQGVQLPGHHPQDHYRAAQDVIGAERDAHDPAATWSGEWDLLAEQALSIGGRSLISHELLSAADADQAARAVRSLGSAQVHVVLTVRDMATLLPAEWQESVKQRYDGTFADWLTGVIDEQAVADDRRRFWFWRVHDTLEIIRAWGAVVPAERIHVVLTPGPAAAPGELWRRFASVIGIDHTQLDIGRARRNTSLGVAETEFLRRFNQRLGQDVPQWFYLSDVKEPLAHDYLDGRPPSARITLPPRRWEFAVAQGARLADALRAAGVDVVGELSDLTPQPPTAGYVDPSAVPDADLVELAVTSAAVMAAHHYRAVHGAPTQAGGARQKGLLGRIEHAVGSSPRLKNAIRTATARSALVRRLRVFAWRQMERTRARRG